jgi:2-oxoisovalerate dehydrogenase E1 component
MVSRETLTTLLRIRRFEERLLKLFDAGLLSGTTHTCIGQEAVPVAVMPLLREEDFVFSNHRGHGHYLARFGDMAGLLAEIMGREGAVCGGVGGSQHIRRGNYFSTGVQGESLPVAFIGDGTWGEGAVYEALNMASLWRLPLIVVCENNEIAQTTPREHAMAGTIEGRVKAFGIAFLKIANPGVPDAGETVAHAVGQVRAGAGPLVLEFPTQRLGSHSKGDDTRPKTDIDAMRANDWHAAARAEDPELVQAIEAEVLSELDQLVGRIQSQPPAAPRVMRRAPAEMPTAPGIPAPDERVVDNINRALHALMRADSRYVFLGEDVMDPYGGAFKVARGLSSTYPDRVLSTPISELGIAGMGNGLALAGHRPIVEFMFGDFIFLAFDQILNFAAKSVTMYGEHCPHPVLFRCPIGGHRGYGPTHSQSVQKYFIGVPNLDLYEASPMHDCATLLPLVFEQGNPAILFENKVMYPQPMLRPGMLDDLFTLDFVDPWTARVTLDAHPTVWMIATGGMFSTCLKAARALFLEHEIEAGIVVPFRLYPFDTAVAAPLLSGAEAIFTVEEGSGGGSWGDEVASALLRDVPGFTVPVGRIHSADSIIPSAQHLERLALVTPESIVRQITAARQR